MSSETPTVMQNPGDTRVPEGVTFAPAKKVMLLPVPVVGVLVEIGWPPKILRWPNIPEEDESAALQKTGTTY